MNEIFDRIWERKFSFLGMFFLIFTLTYMVFVAFDFLPEAPQVDEKSEEIQVEEDEVSLENEQEDVEAVEEEVSESESGSNDPIPAVFPVSININKLGKVVDVLNPESRTIADLDAALLSGVVRHPDSATLGQEGNVFILGHSSYLPNVFNKNFQAFNGIQDLEWGDIIEVSSDDQIFEYRVEKVYRAKADDVTVPIAGSEKKLTLATCNSFGSVDDRYIVEAKQIGVKTI